MTSVSYQPKVEEAFGLSDDASGHPILRQHNQAYEAVAATVRAVAERGDAEAVLRLVHSAGMLAVNFHPGRFADGAIENPVLEIGRRLDKMAAKIEPAEKVVPMPPAGGGDGRRRVLHVATQVYPVGGHTRIIRYWASNDRESRHSLVLTEQDPLPVPPWLYDAIQSSGGVVQKFPQRSSFRSRAVWLRQIAQRSADLVVLHHHGYDPIPIAAMGTAEGPTVVVLNHADHIFWLGSSAADIVFNLRGVSTMLNEPRRFMARNALLPIPLPEAGVAFGRCKAREMLGISRDQVVLLSVGRAEKYQPCGPYDFFTTAGKILAENEALHLYVAGVAPDDPSAKGCDGVRDRLHLLGNIEDPSLYWAAADVYVESFPFGSQTALLEAAASGLPVVPAYDPMFPLLVAQDDALDEFLQNPADEEEYIGRVHALVRRASDRRALGEELKRRLLVDHTGEGWLARLEGAYRQADALSHRPRPIPATRCMETPVDVGLATWQALRPHTCADGGLVPELCRWIFGHACTAKELHDYRSAFHLHAGVLGLRGWNRRSAVAIAKLLPQWLLRVSL